MAVKRWSPHAMHMRHAPPFASVRRRRRPCLAAPPGRTRDRQPREPCRRPPKNARCCYQHRSLVGRPVMEQSPRVVVVRRRQRQRQMRKRRGAERPPSSDRRARQSARRSIFRRLRAWPRRSIRCLVYGASLSMRVLRAACEFRSTPSPVAVVRARANCWV